MLSRYHEQQQTTNTLAHKQKKSEFQTNERETRMISIKRSTSTHSQRIERRIQKKTTEKRMDTGMAGEPKWSAASFPFLWPTLRDSLFTSGLSWRCLNAHCKEINFFQPSEKLKLKLHTHITHTVFFPSSILFSSWLFYRLMLSLIPLRFVMRCQFNFLFSFTTASCVCVYVLELHGNWGNLNDCDQFE